MRYGFSSVAYQLSWETPLMNYSNYLYYLLDVSGMVLGCLSRLLLGGVTIAGIQKLTSHCYLNMIFLLWVNESCLMKPLRLLILFMNFRVTSLFLI
jgi:hypothetical protein